MNFVLWWIQRWLIFNFYLGMMYPRGSWSTAAVFYSNTAVFYSRVTIFHWIGEMTFELLCHNVKYSIGRTRAVFHRRVRNVFTIGIDMHIGYDCRSVGLIIFFYYYFMNKWQWYLTSWPHDYFFFKKNGSCLRMGCKFLTCSVVEHGIDLIFFENVITKQ